MKDYTKEDYPEINEALSDQSFSDNEFSIIYAEKDPVLLSDQIFELVNLFLCEVKKTSSAQSVIDLSNQYFSAIQLPVLIVNDNLQTISANFLSGNIQLDDSQPKNIQQIFSKKDITYLKKNISKDNTTYGPFKSIHSNIDFMIYSYPFKTTEKDNNYTMLLFRSINNNSELSINVDYRKSATIKGLLYDINGIYKTLLDAIDGFYFVIDRSLHLIYISGMVEKKLGYNPGDLEGLTLDIIIPSSINTEYYIELKELNQAPSILFKNLPIKREIQAINNQGILNFYENTITLFNSEISDENYIICSCIDIQGRKMKEKALEDNRLTAEQKDRAKSEFLSNMSHEIRTPLNGIIGFSSMLDKDDLDREKRDKYMKIIRSSSRQLLTLVNDIIDFSKIEAGELKMLFKPADINSIIDELYTTYLQELERLNKGNISLNKVVENTPKQLIIVTDDMRLQQVFVNLLNNALKFTSNGEISFGYNILYNDNNKIRFFVKDTGVGIPKTQQDAIFNRYKQTREGEKPKYNGTGLGLAISKGMVELLGSQLKVDSKVNAGSEFYFILRTSSNL